MKRIGSRLLAPFILVITLAAVFVLSYQPGLPSDAQEELDGYLANLQGLRGTFYTIIQANPAGQPANFTADMSRSTFGDSPYFQTTSGYQSPRVLSAAAQNSAVIREEDNSRRAIPYPAVDLWCVYLEGNEALEVVYLALHEDMYNADWLVHEGLAPASDPLTAADLSELGCPLEAR